MTIDSLNQLRPLRISLIEIFLPNASQIASLLKTFVFAEITVDDRQCRKTESARKVQNTAVFDESLDILVKADSVIKFDIFEKNLLKTYLYGECSVNLSRIFHQYCGELDSVKCVFKILTSRQTIQGRLTVLFDNKLFGDLSSLISTNADIQDVSEATSGAEETRFNEISSAQRADHNSHLHEDRLCNNDDCPTNETAEYLLNTLSNELPNGWEVNIDSRSGRPYYIDHYARSTQWERPVTTSENVSERLIFWQDYTSAVNEYLNSWHPQLSDYTPHQNHLFIWNSTDNGNQSLLFGWEKRYDQNGREYFINHRTRTTQWEDPRTQGCIDEQPLPDGWEMRLAANGNTYFIDHNRRMTTTQDPRKFYGSVSSSDNVNYFHKHKYDRSFAWKHAQFRFLCLSNALPGVLKLVVRRNHLFEDSFNQIMSMQAFELRRRLYIVFHGEEGLDYGGVTREWFFLLSSEVLNPMYCLFEYAGINNYSLQINSASHINPDHLVYFQFVGRLVAMTFFHEKFIDNGFTLPFYKKMLGKKFTLKDIEAVDPEFYNSLLWIKENNVDESDLDIYFVGSMDVLGEIIDKPLIPNGDNVKLCENNKNAYIELMIEWRLSRGAEKQMEAFLRGFDDVVPIQWLRYFDERELQLILCGTRKIDVDDWESNTLYKNYTKNSKPIIWFWRFVREITNEQRTRLLQFVTGTCRVPIGGFSQLMGYVGPQKFCIEKAYNHYWLPVSHVCFNRLDLPPYKAYNELKEKLLLAIEETEGFSQE